MPYNVPIVAVPEITDATDVSSDLTKAADALEAQSPLSFPLLKEAAAALKSSQPQRAEKLLSDFLRGRPGEPHGLYLLARSAIAAEDYSKAAGLLSECLAQLPDFQAARFRYAEVLLNQHKPLEALDHAAILLAKEPQGFLYRDLKARALSALGKHRDAADCYTQLTRDHPTIALFWLRAADKLRSVGKRCDCIAAYRKVIELCPSLGGAYWSLADLKTFQFEASEIHNMEAQLCRTGLSAHNRSYFHFALAKAYADQNLHETAFRHYTRGNALRRLGVDYDPDTFTKYVADCETVFTREFFTARSGVGCYSDAPIFVLGMHRAGSTLIEQILSSHSAIEGIGEAPEIALLARRIENDFTPQFSSQYPEVVRLLDPQTLREFGEQYLASTFVRRRLRRPFFVDKHPTNFWSIGLIQLILPNAKIIDARRHPLACCFSNFTMNFGAGLQHTYRQSDLGRYYLDYVKLMAHFDRALPGRIYRVIHERLIADTEGEVRRLLEYLALPFEQACLEFHRSEREVDTASSEQVRRPINDDGVSRWTHYEPWLGQLKAALGRVVDSYPEVPEFKRPPLA